MDNDTPDEQRPLTVCFFGTYRASYVRNEVIIEGLRQNGARVLTCHATLWHSVADRVAQAVGGWKSPKFLWRVVTAYARLLRAHWKTGPYDVMLVGYPGQFDVFLGRLLAWWRGVPMALDILMSLHLIAEERGLTQKSPFTGRLIFLLEKWGLKLPDLLVADTAEYRNYYSDKYGLPNNRFAFVPLGVDDRLYAPRPHIAPPKNCFRIIYYGTFIPLHGVDTIIRAAALLEEDSDIRFDFYGEGQELEGIKMLANALELQNVSFHGWIEKTELPNKIAQSHLCLGVFGTTKQSRCTIQNKIWEGLMMQRPVITGDADTIRETLTHGVHVYLVERANPEALAAGIRTLKQDAALRQKLVENGFARVQSNTITSIGREMLDALERLVSQRDRLK